MTDLHAKLDEVTAERDALRAQLEGDLPTATKWLQRKVWRQAADARSPSRATSASARPAPGSAYRSPGRSGTACRRPTRRG